MNINIQDSLQQLKEAVEELEALRTVIAMAEDHPVYSCDRETLIVTRTTARLLSLHGQRWSRSSKIFGKSLKLSAKNSKLKNNRRILVFLKYRKAKA